MTRDKTTGDVPDAPLNKATEPQGQALAGAQATEELAQGAERRLKRLGYQNVDVRTANGYYGWPEHAPYDKIMVTASAELIPPPLLAQLKPGGRMVIPTGIPEKQTLVLVQKAPGGSVSTREVLAVRFSELEDPGATAGVA